eukprot:scaffold185720_cov19-Prasinocladus_malaysianus.AAC.1
MFSAHANCGMIGALKIEALRNFTCNSQPTEALGFVGTMRNPYQCVKLRGTCVPNFLMDASQKQGNNEQTVCSGKAAGCMGLQ